MEYHQKILIVTALLVALALFFAMTAAPEPMSDGAEARALLLESSAFGKGIGNHTYSYTDVSDGYKTSYTLLSSGSQRYAEIQNPLSTKKIYLLENDTMLCIRYPVNETCSSIKGDAELQNYVNFVQSKFFNDTLINRAVSNLEFLLNRSYMRVEPDIENATVGGKGCRRIAYALDYSNLSLEEAARFNIGSDSPKVFDMTSCVDASGMPIETTLEYTDKNGMTHTRTTTVLSMREGSFAVTPPASLDGNAVGIFRKEREQQVKLATCHTDKSGSEREGCVADIALILRRKDICELAGSRRDRCLVSIVPLTKDVSICAMINDAGYKDDCYIELAGAYKDASYCANLVNASKDEQCQGAAAPDEADGSGVDIDEFLQQAGE